MVGAGPLAMASPGPSGWTSAAPAPAATAAPVSASGESAGEENPISLHDFKPFVLVRLPYDKTAYPNGGEVLGVSNNNLPDHPALAVGYLLDSSDNPHPFMFSAATNTVTMLDMASGTYDYGQATAITSDGLHIAGWAHNASTIDRAVNWDEANGYAIDASRSPSTTSYWKAVNSSGASAGAYAVSGQVESVVNNGAAFGYPESGREGEANGINANGYVCGTYLTVNPTPAPTHAYRWSSAGGNVDVHPAGLGNASGANCIDGSNNLGGWVTNAYDKHVPTLWSPLSLPGLYQCTILGSNESASAEIVAINSHKEMLINRVDADSGIALWTYHAGGVLGWIDEANVLDDTASSGEAMILMPNTNDAISNGRCLSDDLWIGGSYLVNSGGYPQPCLIIPYDIDNNGIPDYRDIVDSGSYNNGLQHILDTHGFKWLIDVGENIFPSGGGMRVGLDRPGYTDTYTPAIANTQIVRLAVGVHNPEYPTGGIGDDDYYVNGIMAASNSQCAPFQAGINRWYTDGNQNHVGREIVLMLRSNLVDTDPGHDYLPDPSHINLGEGITKAHLLTNLHHFAYKFSRCVDWVQLGNESFSTSNNASNFFGNGGYLIYPNQSGCGTGDTKYNFEQLAQGGIGCVNTALTAVQDWHYEQMWATLEGSALAGRPLRIIGPGITQAAVLDAGINHGSTYAHWQEIDRTITWCNEYQVWFDIHNRYVDYADVVDATDVLAFVLFWTAEYGVDHLVCLELAPKVNTGPNTWWTGGGNANKLRFPKFFDCNQNPGQYWETYISGWHSSQFPDYSHMGVDDAMAYLFNRSFTAVCYGSTLQLPDPEPLHDLAAIRAQKVCGSFFDPNQGHQNDHLTELLDHYGAAAVNYQIDEFNPHDGCDVCGN